MILLAALAGALASLPLAAAVVMGLRASRAELLAVAPLLVIAFGAASASLSRATGLGMLTAGCVVSLAVIATIASRCWRDVSSRIALHRVPKLVGAGALAGVAAHVAANIAGTLSFMMPFYDTVQHGYIAGVARSRDTADLEQLLSFDVVTGPAAVRYYPTAAHEASALLSRASGLGVVHVLVMLFVIAAVVSYPAAIWSIGRRLGLCRAASAVGAAAGCALFDFPAGGYGAFAAIVGTSASTAFVLLVLALEPEHRLQWSLIIGSCLYATLHCYPSSLPVFAMLLVLLGQPGRSQAAAIPRRSRHESVRRWGSALVVAAVLMAPVISDFLSAYGERSEINVRAGQSLATAVRSWVTGDYYAIPVPLVVRVVAIILEVIGIAILFRARRFSTLVVAVGLITLEVVQIASDLGEPWAVVGSLWYRSPERIGLLLGPLRAAAALVAFGVLFDHLRRARAHRRVQIIASSCGIVIVLGVAAAALFHGVSEKVQSGRTIDGRLMEASGQLARLTDVDEIVLTDYCHGSTWIMALTGERPLFGLLNSDPAGQPERSQRRELIHSIATGNLGLAERELLRVLAPRYALLSDRNVCDTPPLLTPAAADSIRGFRRIWTNSVDHIYELDLEQLLRNG